MSTAEPGSPVTPHGVDLVDEDDTRRVRLALLEQITHAARSDADEHLDEIRAGHREERPTRLTGHRTGQESLPRSRGTDQKCALRQATSQSAKLRRILQELDDLLQVLLRLVGAGHIRERDLGSVTAEQLGLRLSETERTGAARLHLAEEEEPETDDQDPREHRDQVIDPVRGCLLGLDFHAPLLELVEELLAGLGRQQRIEVLDLDPVFLQGASKLTLHPDALRDRDVHHIVGIQLRPEFAVGQFLLHLPRCVHHLEDRQRNQNDERPERSRAQKAGGTARVVLVFSLLHYISGSDLRHQPSMLATNGRCL